jgi:hypothetical protein
VLDSSARRQLQSRLKYKIPTKQKKKLSELRYLKCRHKSLNKSVDLQIASTATMMMMIIIIIHNLKTLAIWRGTGNTNYSNATPGVGRIARRPGRGDGSEVSEIPK